MIRRAVYEDKDRAAKLLMDSRAGAGFDRQTGITGFVFPPVLAYAERLFLRYRSAPRCLCLIYEADGAAQGILLASAFEHDFGPVQIAQERAWWIDPAHRGPAAMRMLAFYENWAQHEQECQFAMMAGMGGDPAVGALYRRRGYREAETHYLKALC